MQPGEKGIIMLEDIPVQDESDVSIRTRGRMTNSQLSASEEIVGKYEAASESWASDELDTCE